MALEYLSSTLSEEEYINSKNLDVIIQIKSTLTNVKLFCKYSFNRDFYIVLADLKRESDRLGNNEHALVFMQKFVTWLHTEHPEIIIQYRKSSSPFKVKKISSIRCYIGQLRLYLKRVGGIPISKEDVDDGVNYPEEGEIQEAEPLTAKELRIIIDNQKSPRRKMLYKLTKDTCSRIRAMCQLRLENVNTDVRPIEITFPRHIMKGKKMSSVKYVIKENEEDFLQFLKNYSNPRDLLFGTNENARSAVNNEEIIWRDLMIKIGFDEKYRHNGRLKKNIHSIKAFTETAAEDAVDAFYANAYGDHTGRNYLAQYIRWSYEKKIKKFRKMEPLLSIYTKFVKVSDDKLLEENDFLKSQVDEMKTNFANQQVQLDYLTDMARERAGL